MLPDMTCHPSYGFYGESGVPDAPSVVETQGYGQYVYDTNCNCHVLKDINNCSTVETCKIYQWQYKTEEVLQDQVFTTDYLSTGVASSYDGGGYRVVLPRNISAAKNVIHQLVGNTDATKRYVEYLKVENFWNIVLSIIVVVVNYR